MKMFKIEQKLLGLDRRTNPNVLKIALLFLSILAILMLILFASAITHTLYLVYSE